MLQQSQQQHQQQQQQQQQMMISGRSLMDGSPPVFEQIFRNARFAQGGNAFFEGKVSGNPQPELSWTREGQPLAASHKYQMEYEKSTGKVSLMISTIGPGDEGEYTCTAVNKFGEAICTVYIQPEGLQPVRRDVQFVEQQLQQQHSNTGKFSKEFFSLFIIQIVNRFFILLELLMYNIWNCHIDFRWFIMQLLLLN